MLTEQKLTEYLIEKYKPLAIILHGSRANGTNRPHSDWDVNLLVNKDTPTEQTVLDGEAVDIMSLKIDVDDNKILSDIGNAFYTAKIIYDTDNVGKNFVERVQNLANQGYTIKPDDYNSKKLFLFRIINRLIDASENNSIAFAAQLGNFLTRVTNYYFQVDNRWSKSIYLAIEDIEKNNPELYKELKFITSNAADPEKVESAKRIYKILFKENFIAS